MTNEELMAMKPEEAEPAMRRIADYVAENCYDCPHPKSVIVHDVLKKMVEAHAKGENPIAAMNRFLCTYFYLDDQGRLCEVEHPSLFSKLLHKIGL